VTESVELGGFSGDDVRGIFGAGGFAREVMPLALECLRAGRGKDPTLARRVFFVALNPAASALNGHPLVSEDAFFRLACRDRFFVVAIADSRTRERVVQGCIARGAKPLAIRAPNAVVYEGNEIGEGAILCAGAIVTSNAKIGKYFHANVLTYVAHDCVIGDYVTFAPGVLCAGNVHIGSHAYLGAGVVTKQGTPTKPLVIGEGAVVGMGAVVTKDVPPNTTVVGNPARPFTKG